MTIRYEPQVRMIPVKRITVLNPRDRGRKKFAQITDNIAKLGLKRPVTVSVAGVRDGEQWYDLVCGQGRLEAYVALGQTEIPALVVEGSREDLLLMSLAENLARRPHSAVELVRDIKAMKARGHGNAEIARTTDLDVTYVRGILQLLDCGEERLLNAVERGHLPVGIAITIATSEEKEVQQALQDAYESKELRGRAFLRARRLIEQRRAGGKTQRRGPRGTADKPVSADTVLRDFREETARQNLMIQKARICETKLLFAVSAVRQLLQDEGFVNLLRAEGLDSLPEYLAEQVSGPGETP
jgi:ParB family chromosome partitioning protein